VLFVCCLIVLPLPQGKNSFAVKINNNNNDNNIFFLSVKELTVHNIIFQHPDAIVNGLICRGSPECATYCHAHWLFVCFVTCLTSAIYLHLMKSLSSRYFHVVAGLYCFFWFVVPKLR
jgi:hypothetical protein